MNFALIIPAVLALLLLVLNHIFAWSYFKRAVRPRLSSAWAPTVSVIVPVRGLDQAAPENFRSLYRQAYPNEYEIVFAVEDQDDPAVPVIQRIMHEHARVRSRLVFSGRRDVRANGKIKNMIAGLDESRYEVIIFVDSDVHVVPTFFQDTASGIGDPEVGLAFAVPACEGAEDWVAALHNLAVNASALHYVAAAFQGRLNAAVGSVMATRRAVIEQIGGLEQLGGCIVGIDIALGQAIRRAGYRIQLLQEPARIYHAHDRVRGLWWQMHRWMVTIRRFYPAFPALVLVAALPLWWSLLFLGTALLNGRNVQAGAALVMVVFVAQVASAAVINAKLVRDAKLWHYLWVAGVSELFWLPVFIHSLLSDQVYWRGRWLRVNRDESRNGGG